eukprot:10261502-Heterocapsa_arctica.AAC.1
MCKADEKFIPILSCKDRNAGGFGGTASPKKGCDKYAVAYLTGWLRGLAYKRLVVRSNNEPALLALLQAASGCLPEMEVVFRSSPTGDHQANGLAEVG